MDSSQEKRRAQILSSHLQHPTRASSKSLIHALSTGTRLTATQETTVRTSLIAIGLSPLIASALLTALKSPPSWSNWKKLANLSGFLALQLMAGQTMMGSRFTPIEKNFGFDKVMLLHRRIAYLVLALVLTHVAHKAWGKPVSYLLKFSASTSINYGKWAMIGLILAPGAALLQHSPGGKGVLSWTVWKTIHYSLYATLIAAGAHAWKMGISRRSGPAAIFTAVSTVTAMSMAWRAMYLSSRSSESLYHVVDVIKESYDTTTLMLAPSSNSVSLPPQMAARLPGQFAIIRRRTQPKAHHSSLRSMFNSPPWAARWLWSEPHPFTLSGSAYNRNTIQFTIKSMPGGKFTPTVASWSPGEAVLVEGPYGVFTPHLAPGPSQESNIVMIAGGVGVTPMLSIMRSTAALAAAGVSPLPRLTLIWGIKDHRDLIDGQGFHEMADLLPQLEVVYVFSNKGALAEAKAKPGALDAVPERWRESNLYQGFITPAILKKHIKSQGATWYHCGPPIMAKIMIPTLVRTFGITAEEVKHELFAW